MVTYVPQLCYVFFVVSRITIICYSIRKACVRQVVLDEWLPLRTAWRPASAAAAARGAAGAGEGEQVVESACSYRLLIIMRSH